MKSLQASPSASVFASGFDPTRRPDKTTRQVAPPVYKLAEYLIQNSMLDVGPARQCPIMVYSVRDGISVKDIIWQSHHCLGDGRRVFNVHLLLVPLSLST
jgi:hypothetical protein